MNIKVGDAVMTPVGPGEVVGYDRAAGTAAVSRLGRTVEYPASDLDRLIPDTGLEERVREWAESLKNILPGARRELLALLDTPEAEPEPPPDAGVTREELAQALEVIAWCVDHADSDPARHFAARLRREEGR
jgi:hypothetical protein